MSETDNAEARCISCGGLDPRCPAYHPEYGFICILPPHNGPHYDTAGGHWDLSGQRGAERIQPIEQPTTSNAVYCRITKNAVFRSIEVVPNEVIIDRDANGRIVGIEILGVDS